MLIVLERLCVKVSSSQMKNSRVTRLLHALLAVTKKKKKKKKSSVQRRVIHSNKLNIGEKYTRD